MRLSLIRIGAEISTRPLGGLMRRYRFLMGFARQVQMDAINIQRLPGGSGPNGFRRTGLRSGGLTTAIRHASHSRTTADNDGGTQCRPSRIGNRRCYIQSAYQLPTPEKVAQEKASLLEIDDSFQKIVLVRDVVKPSATSTASSR